MKTVLLVLLLFFSFISPSWSQKITDLSTKEDGEFIYVLYTLVDNEEMPGRPYTIDLYGIVNQEDTLKLREVDGDIGLVYAGENHMIEWNIRKEFERFRGRVAFEIRATPIFEITRPSDGMSPLKRGTGNFIKWYGGGSNRDSLILELYRDDGVNKELIAVIDTVSDDNKYLWRIPPKTEVGKDFRIRILGTEKTGIDEYSDYFTIRRKVPLWLQIVPVAVVGTLVAIFWPDPQPPTDEELPFFPDPKHN